MKLITDFLSGIKNTFFASILTKLVLLFMISVSLLIIIFVSILKVELEKSSKNILKTKTDDISNGMSSYFGDVGKYLLSITANSGYEELVNRYEYKESMPPKELLKYINSIKLGTEFLEYLKGFFYEMDDISLINNDGVVILSTNYESRDNSFYKKTDWFFSDVEKKGSDKKISHDKKSFFKKIFSEMDSRNIQRYITNRVQIRGEKEFYYILKMRSKLLGTFGYLIVQFSFKKFMKSLFKDNQILKTGFTSLIDSNGLLLYHKNKKVKKSYKGFDLYIRKNVSLIEKIKDLNINSRKDSDKIDDLVKKFSQKFIRLKTKFYGKILVYVTIEPNSNWIVVSQINISELNRPFVLSITYILLLILTLIIVFIYTASDVINKFSSNLKNLLLFSDSVNKGHMNTDIDFEFEKEFFLLYSDINKLKNTIKSVIIKTKRKIANLDKIIKDTHDFNSQVIQISKREQALDSSFLKLKELESLIIDLSENSSILNLSFKETFEIVDGRKEEFEKISSYVKSLTKQILFVKKLSSKINMVSLNSSIQAINFGSEGKSFSIVAQEIRNLSDETKSITQNMEETSDNVNSITYNLPVFINKLLPNVNNIYEIFERMNFALQKEKQGTSNILSDIDNMNHIIKANLKNLDSVDKKLKKAFLIVQDVGKSVEFFVFDQVNIKKAENILKSKDFARKIIKKFKKIFKMKKKENIKSKDAENKEISKENQENKPDEKDINIEDKVDKAEENSKIEEKHGDENKEVIKEKNEEKEDNQKKDKDSSYNIDDMDLL